MKTERIKGYRIISIEARDLYECIKKNESYRICDENGKINFDKFTACVYDSIETDKLRKVYAKRRDVKGKFELKE
jgi:hypothetical protein